VGTSFSLETLLPSPALRVAAYCDHCPFRSDWREYFS
jgi:hypothetical protein